ncbi:MAG: hypothetical protein JL50_02930 [Peptococcaceae bacterium BICA1-7]|nr:MAG: hypothetical protein JL50_02930 [Peptococcaceae bacterium BICA1-7]HBV97781.1 hypothetical protein [Desulfotomaculum sp.]
MKPFIVIELDKPRNLRLGINALVLAEEIICRPVTQVNAKNAGVREIRAMLWAGLHHEDKMLTLEQVGDFIEEAGLDYVSKKVTEALKEFTGKNKKGPTGEK